MHASDGLQRTSLKIDTAAPIPLGSYSHAVKAGDFLFISGQGCRDAQTGIEAGITLNADGAVGEYDIEAQTRGCIKNMQGVLKAAGLDLRDLVDVTVFLADMKDFAKYNAVWAEYFNFPDPPARTTVAVRALPGRNFIELKGIAVFPQRAMREAGEILSRL